MKTILFITFSIYVQFQKGTEKYKEEEEEVGKKKKFIYLFL
jgi:hypothetical protein